MKRLIFAMLASLCLVLTVFFSASAADYNLQLSNPVSKDHSWGKGAEKFKELVEQATDGKVKVAVHHGGSLFDIQESLEMAQMGNLAFLLCGSGHVTGYVSEMDIPVLPYLWKDRETMFSALDGVPGEFLENMMAEKDFQIVGWWDNGFRHITNNKGPINAPEDVRGLKIRTLPAKVHQAFFREIGMSPTPMGWTELYPALQQGVVDAQENPPSMTYFGNLYEVQDYYSLTAHANEPGIFVMSKKVLEKLPAEIQMQVRVAAQKATLWQREVNKKDNEEFIDSLKDEGMEINDVPADTLAKFRKAAQNVYHEATQAYGDRGKDLVEAIVFFNK